MLTLTVLLLALPLGSLAAGFTTSVSPLLTVRDETSTDKSSITVLQGTKTVVSQSSPTNTTRSDTSQISISTTNLGGSSVLPHGTSQTTSGSPPQATNSQACNGWPELCSRKYSNVTFVAAHNSPFVQPDNLASNQELNVTTQLNDGVRLLQAQIQFPDSHSEPHFCHSDCALLDAGPITKWLGDVTSWVSEHPWDVVTILLGNGNYSDPSLYAPFIEKSGITQYAYQAPLSPMKLGDWPTLEDMLSKGQRVVMFLDYKANQTNYPWLLDEFTQMWETPFDPTDLDFPCTVQRPDNIGAETTRDMLYLMNHNLNFNFSIGKLEILVPDFTQRNVTNSASGYTSLGDAAANCTRQWNRAPNFLNVDFYNYGTPPGSVFEVAARMNNLTYENHCCGAKESAGGRSVERKGILAVILGTTTTAFLLVAFA